MKHPVGNAMFAVLVVALGATLVSARLGGGTSRANELAVALPTPELAESAPAAPLDTAVFAGGCFWGVEGVFEHLKGVASATAGYAGGTVASPSYEDVSSGDTGHAESVQVVYDPSKISYGQLLQVFFSVAHDPTELNRQGPDVARLTTTHPATVPGTPSSAPPASARRCRRCRARRGAAACSAGGSPRRG